MTASPADSGSKRSQDDGVNGTTAIIGTWFHSYEEDTENAEVYRRTGFAFPLSRGRPGMEFRSDGSYVEIGPGADDRGATSRGQWRDLGGGQIAISFPGSSRPPSVRHILSGENGVLKFAK
jgi:hypothetical protein